MALRAVMGSMLIYPAMSFSRPARSEGRKHLFQGRCAGFTLIELCVVILIIGVITSVSLPQLMPLIAFSELDGQARRLAQYGSAAIAEASLFGKELTVYIDLDNQEIYTMETIYPKEGSEGESEMVDQMGMFSDFRRSGEYSPEELAEMLSGASEGNRRLSGALPDEFDPAEADAQMKDQFDTRQRQMLFMRSKNVKQDEGFLSEIGPLFDEGYELAWVEPYEEELTDPLLERFRMPEGVLVKEVQIEGETITSGVVEIGVTALGLEQPVFMYVANEDEDYFTVNWNPLTGRGNSQDGRMEN